MNFKVHKEIVMAKKIAKIENDLTDANEALKEVKGVTLKNAPAMAAKIADVPTEGGIQRSLSALAFATGQAARKAKMEGYKFDDIFTSYATAFYVKDRKMPTEGSLKGYRSRYNAFCEAGQMPYDATSIVREVLAVRDVNLAWRAGAVRDLLAKFKSHAPKATEVADALAREEGEGGGGEGRTPSQKVKTFVSAGITLSNDEAVKAHLADSVKLAAIFRPIFEGLMQLREMDVAELKGKRKSGAQTEVANLKVFLASITPQEKRGSRRPH
jgi:hypothetical protein